MVCVLLSNLEPSFTDRFSATVKVINTVATERAWAGNAARPMARQAKKLLEMLFGGKASDFKFNFTHVLLMAIVLVLLGILNTLACNSRTTVKKARKKKPE